MEQPKHWHVEILEGLIAAWNSSSCEITTAMVADKAGVSWSRADKGLKWLVDYGFVERIKISPKKTEFKPVKNPDGTDFVYKDSSVVVSLLVVSKRPSSDTRTQRQNIDELSPNTNPSRARIVFPFDFLGKER